MSVRNLRTDYQLGSLNEANIGRDPLEVFAEWMETAVTAKIPEPNAMTVCTVSAAGQPSARIVLLRKYDAGGLQFFTNYRSRKGQEIAASPLVTLLFFWPQLERQIRIEGTAAKVTAEISDQYFAGRPYESQLGAHVSEQSTVIDGPEVLKQRLEEFRRKFPDDVPRPDHWGGYNVVPDSFEFWQGRPSRLHDRILFEREGDNWTRKRLSP